MQMRVTQRRRLMARVRSKAEKEVKAVAFKMLDRRFKSLKRELRRQNLRRRIKKNSGVYKQDDDWADWILAFEDALEEVLGNQVGDFADVENEFFMSRDFDSLGVNPDEVVRAYQARTGRQITNIGQETEDKVMQEIRSWYETDKGLSDLIDDLKQYFDPDRAELIARTETSYLQSEVDATFMEGNGISKWIWDSENPSICDFCDSMNGQVFDLGDPMPPDASHPNCECGVLYADDNGNEI